MEAQNQLLILITIVFLLQVSLVFSVVNVNSALSTSGNNTSWLSASGDFAFGFRQLNGTITNSFSVAIWYDKIPDKTVVWYAKTNGELAEAPPGSQVQLKREGLTLTSPQGDSIWTAKPADNNAIVSQGSMLDSGNFVLVNGESKILWESFQNPTDTLLPNQSLQEPNGQLTSRFSETNYTSGRYQLYLYSGDILFSALAWPSTFQYSKYFEIDASANGSRLVFNNTSGDIYVVTINGTTRVHPQGESWRKPQITLDDPKGYYYRATLDYHGIFTQYAHPRNTTATPQGWKIARYVPDNICSATSYAHNVGGPCGYNSYCSMQNQRPTCTCPNGYSLVDPSNTFGGCQPNFALVCGLSAKEAEDVYDMPETTDGSFTGLDYDTLSPYSKQECQQSCLRDCLCAAAYHDGGDYCIKKGFPLINGQILDGQLIFVKRGTRVNPYHTKEDDSKSVLLFSIIGPVLFFTIIIAAIVLFICLRSKRWTIQNELNLHHFTYDQLKEDTGNFDSKNELGRGGFGIVYKGTQKNLVAVKRLESGQEGDKDFKIEVEANAKTRHKNLVRLIGFCDEGTHRLIVSEFMSKGTLAQVLYAATKPAWNQRVEFALGVARGLEYLHEKSIIHCDIKPQNILIDDQFTAKISDFGFAKLLLPDQSRTKTVWRGTKGYMAPEWDEDVPLSAVSNKVDVYSFGIVLLDVICCSKDWLPKDSNEEKDAKLEGRIVLLMENHRDVMDDRERFKNWVKIAIWCVQSNPKNRPTMRKAVQMLESKRQVSDPPISKKKKVNDQLPILSSISSPN